MAIKWWKKAVVYQIYPLSFQDSNGDGIGDLKGIICRLDYIKKLGVDVIWLSPVYKSPMDDNGYDISDYLMIDPIFGNMDDMKELIQTAHSKDLKIIMDLVLNHTSDEHIWFKEARASKDSKYRDYYIWSDQVTQIGSVFGGPAWTFDKQSNQYYFHLFSKRQPDLNWKNRELRTHIYQMINTWLNMGIDGFRLDVIDLIGKDVEHFQISDGPYLYPFLEELYNACFKDRDIMTVGEMPGLSIERARDITEKKLLDMVFQFAHVSLDEIPNKGKWAIKTLDLVEFKQVFNRLQQLMHHQGWNSLFLSNHDQPRVVSRYGSEHYRKESAKMLATVLYGMQGTPYIYQGEEIGMTGIRYQSINQYQDIETKNIYAILKQEGMSEESIMESIYKKSRDNSRTPFQWDDSYQAGFTSGTPWIGVNPNYQFINAKNDIEDPEGVYPYYQKLLTIRKSMDVFLEGNFILLFPEDPELFIYERHHGSQKILVIGSFASQQRTIELPNRNMSILISNEPSISIGTFMTIPPYYTCIIDIGGNNNANH
jgi:oligo-1,6-glucosidase